MPVDLNQLLDLSVTPAPEFLSNLQGNILLGHGRDHTTHLFVRFGGNPATTREWIKAFARTRITSAAKQFQEREDYRAIGIPGELFGGLLLTATGYQMLGTPEPQIPSDPQFRAGMRQSQATLADPEPTSWETGFQGEIHAKVLLADDDRAHLQRVARQLVNEIRSAGDMVVQIEFGDGLRNANGDSIEHFGYVDGRSQPIMIQQDLDRETANTDGTSVWNPGEPMALVLVPDPGSTQPDCFGSYFVFRKLEQNVRLFKTMERDLAEALGLKGEDKERAGAMVVGRFEDGTPVVLQQAAGSHRPVPNNFTYGDDPHGLKCPFQSHIRKTNPRGSTGAITGDNDRTHLIARRGIPYGTRDKHPNAAQDLSEFPTGGVGLLFMCFQSSLANQFEFMQSAWANNESFPFNDDGVHPGKDPVIGQGEPTFHQPWHKLWGGTTADDVPKPFGFGDAVSMKGGEYFFAPCISSIMAL